MQNRTKDQRLERNRRARVRRIMRQCGCSFELAEHIDIARQNIKGVAGLDETGSQAALQHQQIAMSDKRTSDPCDASWRGVPCGLPKGHDGKHQLARVPHFCHWPGCNVEVPPAMWGCKAHWFRLPKRLRDRVWATYRPGQEVTKTPSPAYIAVATEVQEWIASQ